MEIKIQGETLTLPAGTAPLRKDFRITLDSEYGWATGYYAIENSNGGLATQWKIGMKDDTKTYLDLVNGKQVQASTNYKIADRFYRQFIRAKGRTVTVTLETYEQTTTPLSIDLLFELHKEDTDSCIVTA